MFQVNLRKKSTFFSLALLFLLVGCGKSEEFPPLDLSAIIIDFSISGSFSGSPITIDPKGVPLNAYYVLAGASTGTVNATFTMHFNPGYFALYSLGAGTSPNLTVVDGQAMNTPITAGEDYETVNVTFYSGTQGSGTEKTLDSILFILIRSSQRSSLSRAPTRTVEK